MKDFHLGSLLMFVSSSHYPVCPHDFSLAEEVERYWREEMEEREKSEGRQIESMDETALCWPFLDDHYS